MTKADFQDKIEYNFNDIDLLNVALTHSSFARENKNKDAKYNERLEFLGDAFLDAIVGSVIFNKMKNYTEGDLTKTRAKIVCEQSLAEIGRRIEVGKYLRLGRGEEKAGGRHKESIIADAVEAIIGAIYLDGGYQCAVDFVKKFFDKQISLAIKGELINDYKTAVQEILQVKGKNVQICYKIDDEVGPAHNKTFYVHLECNQKLLGKGQGKTKKEAEQNAAKESIMILKGGANVF